MTDHKADANVAAVQRKLGERSAVGLRKYGTTTERTDLSREDWLRHLQEELMDAAVYIEALTAAHAASEGEDGAGVAFDSAEALADWLETLHETDGPAVTGNKFAPAQRAAAAIRAGDTLQPRREVTKEDVERALDSWCDVFDESAPGTSREAMRAALESFANGGDGNGR